MSWSYAFRLGLQGFRRHPRTMALAVATMALGLAAAMTMLTLLSMLSSDPLPGLSQRLYLAWADSRQAQRSERLDGAGRRPPAFWKLGDAQAMLRLRPEIPQTALVSTPVMLAPPDGAHGSEFSAVLAIGPMTSMFGVPMLHGRSWTQEEERNRTPVIVLSREASLKVLGTEQGVGRDVRIQDTLFRVIGISDRWSPRPHAHYFEAGNDRQIWGDERGEGAFVPVPAALDAGVAPMGSRICDDTGPDGLRFDALDVQSCRWLVLWAQLDDAGRAQAYRDALLDFARDRHASGAFERAPRAELYGMAEWLSLNRVVPANVRLNLWLAFGLLALCMINVAGLLAARFLHRSAELGVRRVLGAPRGAIVAQCLVEAGMAGVLGGLLALPFTQFALWVVRLQDRGYTDMARLQPSLYLALFALSLATGLLVGLIPAWRAARLEPALQVKSL
ncbi:MAG: FtsX-like permease family protein [Gammaproteobacteria bacterium]|uniref:ABC transporter permease n=1 Tax=Pseudomonas sp. Hp2 TaxID=701189 RepID=UPI001C49893F|nr:FtsX-like permease family protein [Pseudomonas sp. Hp2]